MKLIIFSFFLLLINISAFSQGAANNLTYSRVITKNFSLSVSDTSVRDTVPAGKVWKMENIMTSSFMANYGYSSFSSLEINGFRFPIPPPLYLDSWSSSMKSNLTPIWLKSGDVIRVITSSVVGGNFFYSIIEYNEK